MCKRRPPLTAAANAAAQYPEPREVEVVRTNFNNPKIGKDFKKDQGAVKQALAEVRGLRLPQCAALTFCNAA